MIDQDDFLQFCQGQMDITGWPTRERDADCVRMWADDFCVAEVSYDQGAWILTGSDAGLMATDLCDTEFHQWEDAIYAAHYALSH